MKKIILTTLVLGQIIVGCAQTADKKVTADFFYGTWTDSTKVGFVMTKEKGFSVVPEKKIEPGHEDLDLSGVSWTYELFLDKKPIVIEITCRQCDDKPIPKKLFGQISIINSRQIFFKFSGDKGEDTKIRLTKE